MSRTDMKIWEIPLLTVVLYVAFIDASSIKETCICKATWDPVCASNGKTYSNRCTFHCQNENRDMTIIRNGSCEAYDCFQKCRYYSCNPREVCGSDGKTYRSECDLKCTALDHPNEAVVTRAHEGPCKEPCICYRVYRPVCDSNGKTHSNDCLFKCDSDGHDKIVYNGTCEAYNCHRTCPHTPINVCGSDGVTYGNACALKCAKLEDRAKADVTINHEGKCKEPCGCTKNYLPVCGSNGKTYGNECELKCDNDRYDVIKVHDGECVQNKPEGCSGQELRRPYPVPIGG